MSSSSWFEDIQDRLAEWHLKKYGCYDVARASTYRHLVSEIGELGEALMKNEDDEAICEEADCVMILMHFIDSSFGDGTMKQAIEEKTSVIEQRLITGKK